MRTRAGLRRLAYLLIVTGGLGLLVGAVEGVRGAYIKLFTPSPSRPQGLEPTEEDWDAFLRENIRTKWRPYAAARRNADYGLIVAFFGLGVGIPLGIHLERASAQVKQSSEVGDV